MLSTIRVLTVRMSFIFAGMTAFSSASCMENIIFFNISKRNCTQEHLDHDVFAVDFYDDIPGDAKERNTVLPPVKQLNVSYLLSTDLKKVYFLHRYPKQYPKQ